MKKLLLVVGIILFLSTNVFAWGTAYKQLTGSGNNQEVLAIDSDRYCTIKTVTVQNNGSTTSTVSVHFEGTAGQYNRITPPSSLATGESICIDFPEHRPITGNIGLDVDVDISAATTIDIFLVYESVRQIR